MNRLSIALTTWVLAAMPALAGGPTLVVDPPAPAIASAPPSVHDWSGSYVGLSYGRNSAGVLFGVGFATDLEDGQELGVHGGYLFQSGQLVYGGELSYASVSGALLENGSGNDEEIKHVLDVKARVGFAANRALFYGVLGYSSANLIDEVPPIQESDLDGFAAGIGAEFAVTDRLNVGLEYLTRDLSGDYAFGGPGATIDVNVDTLTLRAGLSF